LNNTLNIVTKNKFGDFLMFIPPWVFPDHVNKAVDEDWKRLGKDFREAVDLAAQGKPVSALGTVLKGVVRVFAGGELQKSQDGNTPQP
jgi:hypothetical protein